MTGLNKRRALAQLEQARLHSQKGDWATVETLMRYADAVGKRLVLTLADA